MEVFKRKLGDLLGLKLKVYFQYVYSLKLKKYHRINFDIYDRSKKGCRYNII